MQPRVSSDENLALMEFIVCASCHDGGSRAWWFFLAEAVLASSSRTVSIFSWKLTSRINTSAERQRVCSRFGLMYLTLSVGVSYPLVVRAEKRSL